MTSLFKQKLKNIPTKFIEWTKKLKIKLREENSVNINFTDKTKTTLNVFLHQMFISILD